jgi:hypothetical protein
MTKLELKTHQVWQDLTEVLENLQANNLATEHLELCSYTICGYWDEQDKFHEEIILPHALSAELVSSSLGMTGRNRWIKLKFILNFERIDFETVSTYKREQKIGELDLIYDENMEFIDENWRIDINILGAVSSPTILSYN